MINLRQFPLYAAFIMLSFGSSLAQEITIASISANSTFYNTEVEISGSGFSTTVSDMEVWFGATKGTIVSSRESLIIASVPAGATTSFVTVRNKTNNLTGSSSAIFFPTFQGDPSPDLSITDPYTFSSTNDLFDVTIVDLDNDGKNDLVATNIDNAATNIKVYRNTTDGSNISFAEQTISLGVPSLRVTSGDIDGDGKKDIIVTRENYFTFYVLRNTSTAGSISFAAAKQYSIRPTQFIRNAVVRDLDLDGKPEIIISNTKDDELSIFINISTSGNIQLSSTPSRVNIGGTRAYELIAEDFNYDGKPDLAVIQSGTDIYVLPNSSSSGTLAFDTPIVIAVNGTLNSIKSGDINDDGKMDLVCADFFGNKVAVLLNESTRDQIGFGSPSFQNVEAGSYDIALTDYLGNGKLDILVTSGGSDNLTILKNTSSSGTLTLSKSVIPQPYRSLYIVSGDLSDDGKPDLAFASRNSAATSFYISALRNNICLSPIIADDPPAVICNGQTFTFKTPPALNATFIWKKDGVEVKNSADPFYDASTVGSYTVTAVTDGGACSKTSPAVNLTINSGTIPVDPVASNNGPACLGGSINLQATTVGSATYLWTGPNGYTSTDQNPVITDITPEMAGTYSVKAILSPCESAESSTIVEVINPPDIDVSKNIPGKVCEGELVTLTVGSASGYSYQWYKDNTLISGATANAYDASSQGSYTVNLKGTSNSCDLTSDPVVIETFPLPTPTFTTSGILCDGNTITFQDNSILESTKTPTFSWDFGDGNTSIEQNPTHLYASAASVMTYTVTLTVGYQGHTCSGSTNSMITIEQSTPFIIQTTGSIPFCEGDSVLLEIPGSSFASATWSTGESGFSIYAKSSGTITANATNQNGCISSDQIAVTTLPAPVVTASAESEIISIGQSVQLEATGADSYEWSPAESLDNATSATPIASPTETTTYTVIGTSGNSCTGSAEITITIEDTGDKLPVTAPKLFSPNNDGVDDLWVIDNIQNFPDCEVVIFGRSGKVVYVKKGYNNDWDGRDANNNDLPEGAYYYTISCADGKNASGSISIIR